MPGGVFGQLCYSSFQGGASARALACEQRGHAAIEEDGNAVRLRLPERGGFISLSTMPRQGRLLVVPRGAPFGWDFRCVLYHQGIGGNELMGQPQHADGE